MRNKLKISTILAIASMIMSGCGTTYNVNRVTDFSDPSDMQGIFYYLPRTEVNIEAVAKISTTTFGRYYSGTEPIVGSPRSFNGNIFKTYKELFDHNVKECSKSPIGKPVRLENDNLTSVTKPVSDFAVSTNTEADKEHLYRLDIDPSALASFSHTISVNENGIITGAESTVSDAVSPFVFELFKSGLSLATASFGAGGPDQNYCNDFEAALARLQIYESKLKTIEDARKTFLKNNFSDVSAEIFNVQLKEYDSNISKFKDDRKNQLPLLSKKTEGKPYVVVWKLEPHAGTYTYDSSKGKPTVHEYKIKPGEEDKPKERVVYIPGTSSRALAEITMPAELSGPINNVSFEFDTNGITITKEQALGPDSDNMGYRYRIPVSSSLNIKKGNATVASTPVRVAQFGPIATLPPRFNGSKGVINLTFNPDTGGFTKAGVAGDPISSTAISQYATSFADYKTKENEAETAAKKAASEAAAKAGRADIDANLLEIERLKALKELKELRETLGLEND